MRMVEPLPLRIPHSQVPFVPASPMENRLTILANFSSNACSIPLVVLGGVGGEVKKRENMLLAVN